MRLLQLSDLEEHEREKIVALPCVTVWPGHTYDHLIVRFEQQGRNVRASGGIERKLVRTSLRNRDVAKKISLLDRMDAL